MPTKFGICCVCQERQSLREDGALYHDLQLDGWEAEDVYREYGNNASYIVNIHDSYGELCEGSGQIPQVVCN